MTELTEKQYEDAAQFLNNYINTLQFFANTMTNTLEVFKKRKVKRKFLTSFHKILYCVAKLQVIQKYSEANLKDYYKKFEQEFSQWRSIYSELVPENYVYNSYELIKPHYNSQNSYASEAINSAHNLLDPESLNFDLNESIVRDDNSLHSTEDNCIENSQNTLIGHSQIINENSNVQESNEYASLMESENNEIDAALLKLNDIHDKSFENNDLLDEINIPLIELQTENVLNVNVVPSNDILESLDLNPSEIEKNTMDDQNNEIKSEISSNSSQNDNERLLKDDENQIKPEILSQITNNPVNMELNENNEIKPEILSNSSQSDNERLLKDDENQMKPEILSQITNNPVDMTLNENNKKPEILSNSSQNDSERLFKDGENHTKPEILSQSNNNSVGIELEGTSADNKNNCDKLNSPSENEPKILPNTLHNDNSEKLINGELNQNSEIMTQCTNLVEKEVFENTEGNKTDSLDYLNTLSESENNSITTKDNSIENNNQNHSPNNMYINDGNLPENEKSTDNVLLNLNENSSSMDEDKMAKIEAQILTDSDSIFEKSTEPINTSHNTSHNLSDDLEQTEQNSEHSEISSAKDIEDIDDLLSDIDISDEELKLKYKQAIKNICDDSASCESSDTEKSSDSMDNFENQVLQSQSHGKVVQFNLYDEGEKSKSTSQNSLDSNNLTDKFQKECIVQLQRMDLAEIKNKIQSCSSTSTDDINKLLDISSLSRKRRRISTSSSDESIVRQKNNYKSSKKKRSSSNSSSSSNSDNSSSNSDSSISSDDDIHTGDENISDWIPDISDISSANDKTTDESSTENSDQEVKFKKKRKLEENKKNQNESQSDVKAENVGKTSDKTDKTSGDDWRNDPLLRINLKDKKSVNKKKLNSDSSDVEIIEDNISDDDDVIINEDINESNDKNSTTKKKQKDLLGLLNRKRSITLAISSESDTSDESEAEVENKTTARRKSRKVMSYAELAKATKKANEEEKERMLRLTQKNSLSSQLSNEQGSFCSQNTLILEYNMETKKPRIQVHPELYKVLKDHQKEGVKFMWDSCYESIDLISKNRGSGCVLAHCMGLGKTLQVVTLLYTLFSYPETAVNKVLILAPITTIKNWEREFNRWLSKLKKLFTVNSVIGKLPPEVRFKKIKQWFKNGGVFIMSYSLFRSLTKVETKNKTNKDGIEIPKIKDNKIKQLYRKVLLNPGPDLIICDEGHTLKNSKSAISQCISGIKTSRRIMLTGTPMQNNLKEYYCMINLVKPNLLGSSKEFANQFENPITKGQAKDSSASAIRMMKRRAHVLHKKLSGVVQRVEGSILKPYLPSLHHYIVFIKMSNEQVTIYKKFIEIVKQIHSLSLISTYQRAKKISAHPVCLYTRNANTNPKIQTSSNDIDNSQKEDGTNELLKDSTWYTSLYNKTELERVECSTKLMIFFHLLNQCELYGDKVLAFSTSVNILNVVEFFLNSAPIQNYIYSKWENGVDYVRVDGGTSTELRDQIYENFNNKDNPRLRLLIATTKVTGLGLNLLGANRIVILDTSWNPSDDMQSVYRIYRFGQTKDCYVYSLVSLGTMEEKIYERCVTKQAISCRVVDQQQVDRHYHSKGNIIKEFFTFVDYTQLEHPAPNVPSDRVLATALHKYPDYIFSYHEHDKLLQNQEDEELDEVEREAAWQEFQMEEERLKNLHLPSMELPNQNNRPMDLQTKTLNRSAHLPVYLHPMNFKRIYGTDNLRRKDNLNSATIVADSNITENNRLHYLTSLKSNVLETSSRFFNKLSKYKQTINGINYQNMPSTSKVNDPTNVIVSDTTEPEYILSDTLDTDRMEIVRSSNNQSNDRNPFVNENRVRIDSVVGFNENQSPSLQQNTVSDHNVELPEPEIERNYVVVIED